MNERFNFYCICEEMELDSDDVQHLMSLYQDELDKDLTELASLLKYVSWGEACKKLHKMKGDATNLCLHSLSSLLSDMEADICQERHNPLPYKLKKLQSLAMIFHISFREYVEDRRR